ncbi:MAG TPA: class I SAM-dependent methyltransferase [Bacteroidota bacterium]|nr:class I SAM-dependent methyltransferase [Bacteroidota bacterium]
MKKDKFLRLLVPSVPILSRSPLASILDIADSYIKKGRKEWSELPPASMRLRTGVGNRILRNHQQFIDSGNNIVPELSAKGYLKPESKVLEIGCGCGRNVPSFSRFLSSHGSYTGIDVDNQMIEWCDNHLRSSNIHFYFADVYSKVYNPKGKETAGYSFPLGDSSTDLIISLSLFSHLLYADFCRYISEGARVLRKGGYFHLTVFLIDYLKKRLGDRWTFAHKLDRCYVENVKYPEAAVAYDLDIVKEVLLANNLSLIEIYNDQVHQQSLIAQKK